jgi:hypothetical protein
MHVTRHTSHVTRHTCGEVLNGVIGLVLSEKHIAKVVVTDRA